MSEKFKILGITSGRTMGNAEVVLKECLMECEKLADVEVKYACVRPLKVAECTGCMECMKDKANGGDGKCVIQDDYQWLQEQILWADAIVFVDPSFHYMPTSEIIRLMNRSMGDGKEFREKCRQKHIPALLICVGGSDTVEYNLPMQFKAFQSFCPGVEIIDQCFANWVGGKAYVAFQENLLERVRLSAKRLINHLNGYKTPAVRTEMIKLNPMEYKDDDIVYFADGCPSCHSYVVQMDPFVHENGKFRCTVCGATGHVEAHHQAHKQVLRYVWDDESVAHNRLHPEYDEIYVEAFKKAHEETDLPKASVKEFPILSPANDVPIEKPRIIALVAGPAGGTSELLARRALEEATADGTYEGAIINLTERDIRMCTGCLVCKTKSRYHGEPDECSIKDDQLWVVDKVVESVGAIVSIDGIHGFTYSKLIAQLNRFGHGSRVFAPTNKANRAFGVMISSFDEQTENAVFPVRQLSRTYFGGPWMKLEYFKNVPIAGDGILANEEALGRAAAVGASVKGAVDTIAENPLLMSLIPHHEGVCPVCGLNLIALRDDMSCSCALCDTQGHFERKFGENVILWDPYDLNHSRFPMYGVLLHLRHIDFSQSEEDAVAHNPHLLDEALAKYHDYSSRRIKPAR